mmetsp:Transcript_25831/g.50599  ORF Transcript_25831/g.50599 Transcript_25831/m.50599 type:complete len:242 (-) Transcript_25831:1075-1800(-)
MALHSLLHRDDFADGNRLAFISQSESAELRSLLVRLQTLGRRELHDALHHAVAFDEGRVLHVLARCPVRHFEELCDLHLLARGVDVKHARVSCSDDRSVGEELHDDHLRLEVRNNGAEVVEATEDESLLHLLLLCTCHAQLHVLSNLCKFVFVLALSVIDAHSHNFHLLLVRHQNILSSALHHPCFHLPHRHNPLVLVTVQDRHPHSRGLTPGGRLDVRVQKPEEGRLLLRIPSRPLVKDL